MPIDPTRIGEHIARLRKAKQLTQADLGERLQVSYQAVSKWERGETLPDTALLPDLAQILKTTVDELLNGGKKAIAFRGVLKAEAMFEGVRCLAKMGELLGKQNILYRYAVEGLSEKMNSDVEAMLNDPNLLECLVAEAMICNLRGGYYLDRSDIKKSFQHEKWANIVDEYAQKHGIL